MHRQKSRPPRVVVAPDTQFNDIADLKELRRLDGGKQITLTCIAEENRIHLVRLNCLGLKEVIVKRLDFVTTFYLHANIKFMHQIDQPRPVN